MTFVLHHHSNGMGFTGRNRLGQSTFHNISFTIKMRTCTQHLCKGLVGAFTTTTIYCHAALRCFLFYCNSSDYLIFKHVPFQRNINQSNKTLISSSILQAVFTVLLILVPRQQTKDKFIFSVSCVHSKMSCALQIDRLGCHHFRKHAQLAVQLNRTLPHNRRRVVCAWRKWYYFRSWYEPDAHKYHLGSQNPEHLKVFVVFV